MQSIVIVTFFMSPKYCFFGANIDIIQMSIFSNLWSHTQNIHRHKVWKTGEIKIHLIYVILKILIPEACHELYNIFDRSLTKKT